MFTTGKLIEAEGRMDVSPGAAGNEERGVSCLMGTVFILG